MTIYLAQPSIPEGITCRDRNRGLYVTRISFWQLIFGRGK